MLKQAVILVGGLGTRLGERTRSVPKPLLEVAGRPFLDYILDELSRYPTIQEILLLAGHQAGQVVDRYQGRRWRGATVSVISEPAPLGTGGALKNAASRLESRFLLLNGDSFFDFNMLDLAAGSAGSSGIVRVALKSDHPGDRYGRVLLEEDFIKTFLPAGSQPNGPINSGVYCVDRDVLALIDELPCSLEQVIFPRLAEKAQLRAALYDGFFIDIGIPADFERAQSELPERVRRPAVFFDRDGVLNVDKGYVYKVDDFEWIPGAREAIKLCNDRGYLTFIVTNQSGVARGYYGTESVEKLHDWMSHDLAEIGAHIDEFQYCPYHEEGTVEQWRRAERPAQAGTGHDSGLSWRLAGAERIQLPHRRQASRCRSRCRRRNTRASVRGRRSHGIYSSAAWVARLKPEARRRATSAFYARVRA